MGDRLRFTLLGCGSSPGTPRITGDWGNCDPTNPKNRRMRAAALVERISASGAKTTVVIDTGPDFRAQMLMAGVKRVDAVIYTHPHADHFSAAHYLKQKTGAPTAIGERVVDVQKLWKAIYNWPDLPSDGRQWDRLFGEGEVFSIGRLPVKVLFSPGHTLASITYVVGDSAFVHDTLFMPDSGTARCDFPGGSASRLWGSLQGILALPDHTRIFVGHDYQAGGREPRWESTVGEQKASNIHLVAARTEAEFVALREARDRTLPMPRLMLHALQININGGRLPEPEANGRRYLKFPLDAL